MATNNPYPVPAQMSPILQRVLAYWESLKRGENDIPFWDDVAIEALPDLSDRLMLIDVFVKPERFRFSYLGPEFTEHAAPDLVGRFADDVTLGGELKYFRSQASATVEAGEPTLYHHNGGPASASFSRLIMPMWGDGHVKMLFGALDPR